MADEPEENVAPQPPTEEQPSRTEIEAAASAENQAYLNAQLGYLQNRVANLRIQLNRALARVAELESPAEPTEAPEAETPQEDPQ